MTEIIVDLIGKVSVKLLGVEVVYVEMETGEGLEYSEEEGMHVGEEGWTFVETVAKGTIAERGIPK